MDISLKYNNDERPHSGKHCYGKTPMQTCIDSLHPAKDKLLYNHYQKVVSLSMSEKMETGSAGEQPANDNLTEMDKGNENPPLNIFLFQEIMA